MLAIGDRFLRFGFGKGPVEEDGAVGEVSGDGAMGGNEPGGCGEGFVLCGLKLWIGTKIGESGGVGLMTGGLVEALLELADRPAGHEDIEGASSEGA